MFKHSRKILIPLLGSLAFLGATNFPESSDTITLENVTVPTGYPFDFTAYREEGSDGQIGTHESSGVGTYNVAIEEGADSI